MAHDDTSSPGTSTGLQRLSSSALPRTERIPIVRELYARELMRVDLQATSEDGTLDYDVWVKTFGGVSWARSVATPVTMLRTGDFLTYGSDDVYLATSSNGATIRLADRDIDIAPNDYFLMSKARAHQLINHGPATSLVVQVPHADLARLLPDLEEAPVHAFSRHTPGIGLLFSYADAAVRTDTASTELTDLASRQLRELFASVLGAAPELTWKTRQAALLQAIRKSVAARSDDPDLRLADLAYAHGFSPRYIHWSDGRRRPRTRRHRSCRPGSSSRPPVMERPQDVPLLFLMQVPVPCWMRDGSVGRTGETDDGRVHERRRPPRGSDRPALGWRRRGA